MLCLSHDPSLSEGEKLSSTHGILLQVLQSRTLLQEKLLMRVTLYIPFVTCRHVPENPALYKIQGANVTLG